jgi:hypothetical protein
MGALKHMDTDREYEDFLQEIVDGEHLEGAALGITKLVIDKGEDALSDKQRFVFNRESSKNSSQKSAADAAAKFRGARCTRHTT